MLPQGSPEYPHRPYDWERNIWCWNSRNIKSEDFLQEIKEIIRVHRPLVIVFLELRIGRAVAYEICKEMGNKEWIWLEAYGFSGGIWTFGDQKEIQIKIVHVQTQFIHALVIFAGRKCWNFTAVYASQEPMYVQLFWAT